MNDKTIKMMIDFGWTIEKYKLSDGTWLSISIGDNEFFDFAEDDGIPTLRDELSYIGRNMGDDLTKRELKVVFRTLAWIK